MSTATILSSPFLTHNILDNLLSQSPSLTDRINLLSAKIHLYANPSIASSPSNPFPADPGPTTRPAGARSGNADRALMEEMKTRIEVAGLWLEEGKEDRSAYTRAEAELGVVIEWAKGALKGIQRRKREREKRADGIGVGSEHGNESEPVGKTGNHSDEIPSDGAEGNETPWEEEVRAMKRSVEGMMVLVQVGLGREHRAEKLRRQVAEANNRVQ